MNSSSKVPPRFVPTLTEVVQIDSELPEQESGNAKEPEALPEVDEQEMPVRGAAEEVAPAQSHSPWLADGLYARRQPAVIPHDLPPLPDSLPPQQPFAHGDTAEAMTGHIAEALRSEAEQDLSQHAEVLDEQVEAVELNRDKGLSAADIEQEPQQVQVSSTQEESLAWNAQAPQVTEEYLVHRLMQRVDLVLDQRLKEAISLVVQEQTRSIVLRLREEVESVVRQAVYEAVEEELALQTKPKSG